MSESAPVLPGPASPPAASAVPLSDMAAAATFGCSKWADCSCAASSSKTCACGDSCSCGSVSTDAVRAAMSTMCGFSNCKCGVGCACGVKCTCGGTVPKTTEAWINTVKALEKGEGGCKCTKEGGVCVCDDGCSCGGSC